MWKHGEILRYLVCTILFLIPKGNSNTRGFGLLELLRKVVEAIIDTGLRSSACLHNVLHGFCAVSETGTVILELKLAQELASLDQEPLFLVFPDLLESYYTVDHGHLIMTL